MLFSTLIYSYLCVYIYMLGYLYIVSTLLEAITGPFHEGRIDFVDWNRAHSPTVLHWLDYHKFDSFLTDFSGIGDMPLSHTKIPIHCQEVYQTLLTGHHTISLLLDPSSNNRYKSMVLVDPEPSIHSKLIYRVLQENLLELHSINQPFKLGVLVYMNMLHLTSTGDVNIGLSIHLCTSPVLDIHMWPFIDKVIILKDQQCVQFGVHVGEATTGRIGTTMKHVALVIFSSDNQIAKDLLQNMIANQQISDPFPNAPKWGAHQLDLTGKSGDPRIPTWHWLHCPLPLTELQQVEQLHGHPGGGLSNQAHHLTFTLDISISQYAEFTKLARLHLDGHSHISIDVDKLNNPRHSFGSCLDDKRLAFDFNFRVEGDSPAAAKANASPIMSHFVRQFSQFTPLVGWSDLLLFDQSSDIGSKCVILVVNSNMTLQQLFLKQIITQCMFLIPHTAVVTQFGTLQCGTPDGLAAFMHIINEFNTEMEACPRTMHLHVRSVLVSLHPSVQDALAGSGRFNIASRHVTLLPTVSGAIPGAATHMNQAGTIRASHQSLHAGTGQRSLFDSPLDIPAPPPIGPDQVETVPASAAQSKSQHIATTWVGVGASHASAGPAMPKYHAEMGSGSTSNDTGSMSAAAKHPAIAPTHSLWCAADDHPPAKPTGQQQGPRIHEAHGLQIKQPPQFKQAPSQSISHNAGQVQVKQPPPRHSVTTPHNATGSLAAAAGVSCGVVAPVQSSSIQRSDSMEVGISSTGRLFPASTSSATAPEGLPTTSGNPVSLGPGFTHTTLQFEYYQHLQPKVDGQKIHSDSWLEAVITGVVQEGYGMADVQNHLQHIQAQLQLKLELLSAQHPSRKFSMKVTANHQLLVHTDTAMAEWMCENRFKMHYMSGAYNFNRPLAVSITFKLFCQ